MSKQDTIRINERIKADQIRFVDGNGDMRGLMSPEEALKIAQADGLDLVEVSPNAEPPVCKALDFGKYKYELQKKKAIDKKKQKVISIKEVKLKPRIGENDYQVKLRGAIKFLTEGDKVKVGMRFRGREVAHSEIGMRLVNRFVADLAEYGDVNPPPKLDGMQISCMVSPKVEK